MTSEREVKRVDDQGVRENGSISIVCSCVEVVPPRESISRSHVSPRGNFPDEIKVLKEEGPASLSLREFARVLKIG